MYDVPQEIETACECQDAASLIAREVAGQKISKKRMLAAAGIAAVGGLAMSKSKIIGLGALATAFFVATRDLPQPAPPAEPVDPGVGPLATPFKGNPRFYGNPFFDVPTYR